MALPTGKTAISITIDGRINVLLQDYSDKIGAKKAKFAKDLIYSALRSLNILKSIGFLAIAKNLRDILQVTLENFKIDKSVYVWKDEDPVTITVTVDNEIKELMQEYADYLEIPFKIMARNAIYIGLDDFKVFDKLGIVKLSKYCSAFRRFVAGYNEENEREK